MDERSNPDLDVESRGGAPGQPPEQLARTFEVTINGLVPAAVLADLGDVEVSSQEVRTVLNGRFRDQSEVYGFLHRLRTYALEVIEVRRVGGPDQTDAGTDGR
jgi:hypothetical protein